MRVGVFKSEVWFFAKENTVYPEVTKCGSPAEASRTGLLMGIEKNCPVITRNGRVDAHVK